MVKWRVRGMVFWTLEIVTYLQRKYVRGAIIFIYYHIARLEPFKAPPKYDEYASEESWNGITKSCTRAYESCPASAPVASDLRLGDF